jgi:hypothetical protein
MVLRCNTSHYPTTHSGQHPEGTRPLNRLPLLALFGTACDQRLRSDASPIALSFCDFAILPNRSGSQGSDNFDNLDVFGGAQ